MVTIFIKWFVIHVHGIIPLLPATTCKYSCGVRRAGRACRAQACLGGFVWLSRARPRFFVLGHPLSERRGFSNPRPMGLLTARILGDSSSAPPQVSTHPSSFVRPYLGSHVSFATGPSQQSPVPWLRLALSAIPRRFPIQTKGMSILLTRLLGMHDRTTLTRNHTLSPSLFGYTPRWLANYSS